jgi:hypothetical protein
MQYGEKSVACCGFFCGYVWFRSPLQIGFDISTVDLAGEEVDLLKVQSSGIVSAGGFTDAFSW